jgi:type IV conjugative transfer system protein TraE
MDKATFDRIQQRRKVELISLSGLLVLSIAVNLILAIQQSTTVVLIPGSMTGEWQITHSEFDDRYLADASASLAETYLETTPSTAEWRRQQILKWVHPESSLLITKQFDDETDRIKGQKLSSAFAINAVAVNANNDKEATVRVTGVLTRFVTDKRFAQENVVVIVTWGRDVRGAATIRNLTWKELEKNEEVETF